MALLRRCSVDGCNKPAYFTREWCRAHYQRWRRHGDPLGGRISRGTALLWLREVALPYKGVDCLIWPFGRSSNGYGAIWISGQNRQASRLLCKMVHGPAPSPKHEAAHLCGLGHIGCCTPAHIEWKTSPENNADKLAHGTHNRGERHSMVKLTEDEVRSIRACAGKISHSNLAEQFSVSKATITHIITRRNWAWLT